MNKFKKWFLAASVRAVKTAAQSAIGAIGAATVVEMVDWKFVLSTAAIATVISYLMSIGGLPEVKEDDVIE